MRFTSLFLLQGLAGLHLCSGFYVRPSAPPLPRWYRQPRSSSVPTALSQSTMGEQEEVKTYPPPNAVPDGMKTYEVRRPMACFGHGNHSPLAAAPIA